MYCKHLYYEFIFLFKVNYNNDKFMHTPTYTYNEVMQLLEHVGVVEHNNVLHVHLPTYIFTGSLLSIYLLCNYKILTLHLETIVMKSS